MSSTLPVSLQTVALLIGSRLFMTCAWYGQLSAIVCVDQPVEPDCVWTGLCLVGAMYSIYRA